MNTALLIARRELTSYFRSWMGPVIVSGALLIDGIFFYWIGLGQKLVSAEVLQQFFYNTSGVTMVAALFLSMRVLAEERQTGTLVLLNTSPVKDRDIVLGKFLGAFGVLAATTLLSCCRIYAAHDAAHTGRHLGAYPSANGVAATSLEASRIDPFGGVPWRRRPAQTHQHLLHAV